MREIVERYDGDAERVANELVEAANEAGGSDNITALFVAGPEFRGALPARPRSTHREPRGSARRAAILTGRAAFLIYGVLIGMLLWAVAMTGARMTAAPDADSAATKSCAASARA